MPKVTRQGPAQWPEGELPAAVPVRTHNRGQTDALGSILKCQNEHRNTHMGVLSRVQVPRGLRLVRRALTRVQIQCVTPFPARLSPGAPEGWVFWGSWREPGVHTGSAFSRWFVLSHVCLRTFGCCYVRLHLSSAVPWLCRGGIGEKVAFSPKGPIWSHWSGQGESSTQLHFLSLLRAV